MPTLFKYAWAVFVCLLFVFTSGLSPFGEWPPMPPQDKFLCMGMIFLIVGTLVKE